MQSYNAIKKLIKEKKLEIVYVLSPPRTASTAIHISLTQNSDGQILEPFNVKKRDNFSEGCKHILERTNQLFKKKQQWPIRLVVKDIARNINLDEWGLLKEITGFFVFTIREPSLSIYSFLKRRVNPYDSDKFGYEKALKLSDKIPEEAWHDSSWLKIKFFLDDINQEEKSRKKISILSDLSLRLDPEKTMRNLSKKFGWLPFNDRLIKNWEKGVGKNLYSPPYKTQDYKTYRKRLFKNIWIKEAIWSNSFKPINPEKDSPRDLTKLPINIRDYYALEMLPTYIYFISRKENDSKLDSLEEIRQMARINPIEAYFNLRRSYPQEKKLLNKLEKQIKRQAPFTFSIIKVYLNKQWIC